MKNNNKNSILDWEKLRSQPPLVQAITILSLAMLVAMVFTTRHDNTPRSRAQPGTRPERASRSRARPIFSPEVPSAHERGRFSLEKFPPLMSAADFRTKTIPRS